MELTGDLRKVQGRYQSAAAASDGLETGDLRGRALTVLRLFSARKEAPAVSWRGAAVLGAEHVPLLKPSMPTHSLQRANF